MGDLGIESQAAASLRRYEGLLWRAREDHDSARKSLDQAVIELHKAEAAFDAAKSVYQAANADRRRDLGLEKVQKSTLSWINKLSAYPHFGTAELQEAAVSVGLNYTPANIRQHTKRLCEKGVFTKTAEGIYRISDVATDVLSQYSDPSERNRDAERSATDLGLELDQLQSDTHPSQSEDNPAGDEPIRESREDWMQNAGTEGIDGYDDDLAF